jgi:hypothetical protein
MTTSTEGSARRWFRRILWLGIAANIVFAVPMMIAPGRMLAWGSLPPVTPILWMRFAALLLILLSVFYMPAGIDPDRYRATAWTAVLSRLAGVVFFFSQPTAYHMLGLFDLIFCVPEGVLLSLAIRHGSPAADPQYGGALR